jgi:hypothetical protein
VPHFIRRALFVSHRVVCEELVKHKSLPLHSSQIHYWSRLTHPEQKIAD